MYQKVDESDKISDVVKISESDLYDSEVLSFPMQGIKKMNVDNLDESRSELYLDSQATSEAGLSFAGVEYTGDFTTPLSQGTSKAGLSFSRLDFASAWAFS